MSSEYVSIFLKELVRKRAGYACEYCRLPEMMQEGVFHIDHVIPLASGGRTVAGNLALACITCSLRKAARTELIDPETAGVVPFFNPRKQKWHEHFRWDSGWIATGLTPTGTLTIGALAINSPRKLLIRKFLAAHELFP